MIHSQLPHLRWAEKDSNLRTRERTDLQSVAFSHSAICPYLHQPAFPSRKTGYYEPKKGVEPPTY